jgi:hypothetical protein
MRRSGGSVNRKCKSRYRPCTGHISKSCKQGIGEGLRFNTWWYHFEASQVLI